MRNKIVLVIIALYLALSLTLSFAQDKPVTLFFAVSDEQGRPSEPYVLDFVEQVETLSDGNITITPIWDAGGGYEEEVIQTVTGGHSS